MNLKQLLYKFAHPNTLIDSFMGRTVSIWSDEFYLKVVFLMRMGYRLNLKNPKTFSEKLQWLKLNDIHQEYTQMVDKVAAKDYVKSIIGEQYIIPTLGIWDSVEEIDWMNLPNQFVIKSTGDSGGVVVCKDINTLDIQKAKSKLSTLGSRDYTKTSKEYPYKNVPHRYIAEQYMEDESGYELKDYKFFCFNGVPKFLFVATGRQNNDTRFDFYDTDFRHLPVTNGHLNANASHVKPSNFDKMLELAAKLSRGIPHVRVDLYNINGSIYFGEMTFFHNSGMVPFKPKEWDYKFGEYIDLDRLR